MRARRGLIPSRFLVLLLPLILVSCSGGGNDAPPSLTAPPGPTGPPPPPAPVGLLYRTDTTLVRSQTDGSGQVTLVDEPEFDLFGGGVFVSGTTVLYHTMAPALPPINFGLNDIWQVQTNGTGKRAVVNTKDAEIVRDVLGPWVLYEHVIYRGGGGDSSSTIRSARLDGTAQHLVTDAIALYQVHVGERAVFAGFGLDRNLFSVLMDGTDVRPLTTLASSDTFLSSQWTAGSQVIFSSRKFPESPNIFAVPVLGGPVSTLAEGPEYKWVGAVVGDRVVYHRCAIVGTDEFDQPVAGPCDVYSVLSNGTGTVALATHPENEAVQGVVGTQVIVRRNMVGDEQLYAIAVDGSGAEVPIVTLGQNEFVAGIVGERIVLLRSTGLWSVKADGSGLVQLPADTGDAFGVVAVGPFACFTPGSALWCVPADGSGPATQVTANGNFVFGVAGL